MVLRSKNPNGKTSFFNRALIFAFILTIIQVTGVEGADPRVEKIDKEVERIEKYIELNEDRLKFFQVLENDGDTALVQVTNPIYQESEVTYYVLENESGKVLYHKEAPSSMSGDWHGFSIHYFDKEERTIKYSYSYSEFNRCVPRGLLRIKHNFYFNSDFELIKKVETILDDDKEAASVEGCDIGEHHHTISKNWSELKKVVSKEVERIKKERAFNTCRENLEPTLRFSKKGRNLCFELLD